MNDIKVSVHVNINGEESALGFDIVLGMKRSDFKRHLSWLIRSAELQVERYHFFSDKEPSDG